MDPFTLQRLGVVMEPEQGNPHEVEGVLNPGAIRGKDGTLYLREILYRSAEPILTPELHTEKQGTVPNVVFPTGIDRRDDLGTPDRIDVYYGMADYRIGVARLDVPETLPPQRCADPPDTKV